eukprot:TRINITY_DN11704_c0_g1_i1.p1 TRINITY_DN11704_c0_g1~~TRINITY_DN11704_c0_g1_i1.p1  ORF type:complete len:148 (-),score=20.16 TRINITY_DN11704_c0_g1_i1:54-497(-)
MNKLVIALLAVLVVAVSVDASSIVVHNSCGSTVGLVWRGAYGKLYHSGSLGPGQTWSNGFDAGNCESCNIAINTGGTMTAEWSDKAGTIWWNLSTDAGYQWPPFRMSCSGGGPSMYCNGPTCPDGHPGDSHINNCRDGSTIYVTYCG